MNRLEARVVESFKNKWRCTPTVLSKAPGRVNLIGEHTDYTGGYVLPIAINRSVVFAAAATTRSEVRGYSLNYQQAASCGLGNYERMHPVAWFRYVIGVLSELDRAGYPIGAFDFCLGGDIPMGSGLSSSAALGMAVLTAMEQLGRFKLSDVDAALLCQRAENDFVGVRCGIMDMLISKKGIRNHALFIDCSDLSSRDVRIDLPGYSWLVVDSGKRRGLVESEYNQRRLECEEALKMARLGFPERSITNLRDISVVDLPLLARALAKTIYRRLAHVVSENARVLEMLSALEAREVGAIGYLLSASHESLRDNFEVSCRELDRLVEIVSCVQGVCGARLTGAGFGGSIIVIARTAAVADVRQAVAERYNRAGAFGAKARVFPVRISDGAQIMATGQ